MSRLVRRVVVALAVLVTAGSLLTLQGTRPDDLWPFDRVADLSQFDAGNIISDEVFFAGYAMSAGDVQTFLNAKVGNCKPGADGSPCLKDYRQDTNNRPADVYCNGYAGAPGESAATIIAKTAISCSINPKVLLVMLQKEQGLVLGSGSGLTATRYKKAMGFACPDTAPCDEAYFGFHNQVYSAARQYQRYTANAANYAYRAGRTVNVLWSPTATCGSGPVTIANQATANLYIYTPYQPNAAALRAGYGTGDGCSAYGNRNFWLYFTDWFGSTQSDAIAAATPKGLADNLSLTASGFTAKGWAFDPDAPHSPVTVRATVDGATVASTSAGGSRPDVGSVHGVGPNHGFEVSGLLSYGTHQVCLIADNLAGQGMNFQFGCRPVTFTDRAPEMSLDVLAEQPDGSILLSGWVYDPDGNAPQVHVYTNGRGVAHTPNVPRPDVQAAFPAAGPAAGFRITVGPLSGRTDLCVFAVDGVAPGNNRTVACREYAYRAPVGSVDSIAETVDGKIRIQGWALDESMPAAPIQVHAYVNGRGVAIDATGTREDIGRAYSGAGTAHGFDATLPSFPGRNQICVFGINIGVAGTNPVIGCTAADLQYKAPEGVVDAVAPVGDGRVRVGGWVFDPSVPTAPANVHIYVDGRYHGAFTADGHRPDIAAAFPGVGAAHGFNTYLDIGTGRHQVCTFAINLGLAGTNPLLDCSQVTVTDRMPMGSVDSVAVGAPGEVAVQGWTFDPDAPTQTVQVRVAIDGVDQGVFPAAGSRPDVGRVHPEAGAAHGFAIRLPLAAGPHEVCVSAHSTGVGGTPTVLRCVRLTA
ncbi:hypothetical protein O2W15_12935 [Modestobacter sp. VKM Ac-2979]|uniref:hypothetical protein n=1 Tax=unclassified Modestobacter TaxID=2643866 RepID=UPI0022AB5092|nr:MULTISPECIES: hypothetical protein [unclassified Modestobacter]MCZ2812339.1 hypothetical protein [Modestobacter sp. VKM Ac-2979]MCZ2841229.1 hypothetical protein [Modestobacter sp. VKM Ac-2980]